MKFSIGQRVRTRVELTSAPGFPPEDAIPVNSAGTVDYVHDRLEGYGVVFDCDPHKLSAWCVPAELEAAE